MTDARHSAARQNNTGAESLGSTLDLATAFQNISALLHKEFGDTAYRSWIAPLTLGTLDAGTLTLQAPTRLVRDWVRAHYADRIRALWIKNVGPVVRVEIAADSRPQPKNQAKVVAFEPVAPANDAPEDTLSSGLDARFTFENFITGKSNELAYAAARRVAESDAITFNPLFLQGGVGLGKTHLMHAVAQAIRAKDPSRKVLYMSAEKFMYQFVRALRFKDTMAFKEQFRSVDVLMIDDIQFICGKDATQEEFFHTFNALIEQKKQIIVSADKSPTDMDGLEERLRSRLSGGLVAHIHPTAFELRLGILQSKCALMKREIAPDVLEFLAERITANVRELEGALNRLIVHAELAGKPVTRATAEELLQDLLRASDRRVSIEDIQKKVAEHYGIRVSDMHSPRRARPVARPRQVAMYLAKALTQHSLPEIGRKFGGRDHTTIIHGIRKIEDLMARDPALRDDVELLKKAV